MKRLVADKLIEWRDSPRRMPLIVRGARQVGKTYSVLEFGQSAFAGHVHHIDLELRRDAHAAFATDVRPDIILRRLEAILGTEVVPGRDLLFLDEIQACPRAITALRYFCVLMPELHVVSAGSLMELALVEYSTPAGCVQSLEMRPLTFVEYLWAVGDRTAADVVLAGPAATEPVAHEALLKHLRDYLFVGGMPAVVRSFVEKGAMREVFALQDAIIATHRDDFGKYGVRVDRDCLDEVLRSVARSVGRQVKYARLASGYRGETIKRCFELLVRAHVLGRVTSAGPAGLPLEASPDHGRFKAVFLDVGLMQRLNAMPHDISIASADLLSLCGGSLAEQVVGQEFLATFGDSSDAEGLHYWSRAGEARGSTAEVDYLMPMAGRAAPIEVKSGPVGKLRGLHLLLREHPQCAPGIVLSEAPFARLPEHKLAFVPIYFAGSLASCRLAL